MDYVKMSDKQVIDDAYTVMTYVTLATLETELQDVEELIETDEVYSGIYDVKRVLEKAIELMG
jgi:hypothetical protein